MHDFALDQSRGSAFVADLARMGPDALVPGTSWSCLRSIAGFGLPLLGSMLWALRHTRLDRA